MAQAKAAGKTEVCRVFVLTKSCKFGNTCRDYHPNDDCKAEPVFELKRVLSLSHIYELVDMSGMLHDFAILVPFTVVLRGGGSIVVGNWALQTYKCWVCVEVGVIDQWGDPVTSPG